MSENFKGPVRETPTRETRVVETPKKPLAPSHPDAKAQASSEAEKAHKTTETKPQHPETLAPSHPTQVRAMDNDHDTGRDRGDEHMTRDGQAPTLAPSHPHEQAKAQAKAAPAATGVDAAVDYLSGYTLVGTGAMRKLLADLRAGKTSDPATKREAQAALDMLSKSNAEAQAHGQALKTYIGALAQGAKIDVW